LFLIAGSAKGGNYGQQRLKVILPTRARANRSMPAPVRGAPTPARADATVARRNIGMRKIVAIARPALGNRQRRMQRPHERLASLLELALP